MYIYIYIYTLVTTFIQDLNLLVEIWCKYFSVLFTLSGRTGSALAWHAHGRVFEPRLLQQVLRLVARN